MNTKEHILSGARKVFERFGFQKTSMSDIALAARKGRRTIYSHFDSKEAVFKAVIDTEVKALSKKLQEIARQDQAPDLKLRSYLQARMRAIRELSVYYAALREDLLQNMGVVETLRQEYDQLEISIIKGMLDEGNEAGIFRVADTRLVAEAILIATKGFELPIFMGKRDYDNERHILPMIDVLYEGIRAKPERPGQAM